MPAPLSTAGRVGLALTLPVSLFGVGVGALMTWHHDTQLYGTAETQGELVGCTESATVNCDIVNTSAWSEVAGVPIATLAIAAYLAVFALAVAGLLGRRTPRALLVVAGVVAVACSGFLFWQSKVELGYVCAWCLRLYGVNAALLFCALLGGVPPKPEIAEVGAWGALTAALLGLAGVGERGYRRTLGGAEGAPVVAAAATDRAHDPTGPAPTRAMTVTTEENQPAELRIDADDAWLGNPASEVAVVMYGDLECGFCKRTSAELARLEATYGDRVLFVFKHFPMNPDCNPGVKNKKHRDACNAAVASVCAQDQGAFWQFHDLAYKNQHELAPDALRQYAKAAGVADAAKFEACLASPEAKQRVVSDAAQGQALAIHGTPRVFIGGKLYRSGTSAEVMARAIEAALGSSAEEAAKNAATWREGAEVALPPVPADTPSTRALDGYEIDTFEAAIVDGKAVSERHRVPALRSTWFDADAACKAAGKRLCTEAEWLGACQGAPAKDDDGDGAFADDMIEGTPWPYGEYHTPGRCWDDHADPKFRPVYTGELPGCVTPAGVYDLTGNLEEWVGATPETAALLGGAWDTTEDHARCYRRNDAFGAGYASPRTGFRCCR